MVIKGMKLWRCRKAVERRVADAMSDTRVVLIVGPRQSGKTTLAKKMANLGMEYYTLDNATTLDAARQDPAGFVRCMDRAIVDEIQRAPELLLAIKESVDTVDIVIEDRRGRVVGIEIKAAAAAADGGACFRLKYDGRKLPFLQTLRNAHEGINVFCIEPATHDRLPRKELREMEALASTPRGGSHMFHLEMLFDSGK